MSLPISWSLLLAFTIGAASGIRLEISRNERQGHFMNGTAAASDLAWHTVPKKFEAPFETTPKSHEVDVPRLTDIVLRFQHNLELDENADVKLRIETNSDVISWDEAKLWGTVTITAENLYNNRLIVDPSDAQQVDGCSPVCRVSKPCGDGCIPLSKMCHLPKGKACSEHFKDTLPPNMWISAILEGEGLRSGDMPTSKEALLFKTMPEPVERIVVFLVTLTYSPVLTAVSHTQTVYCPASNLASSDKRTEIEQALNGMDLENLDKPPKKVDKNYADHRIHFDADAEMAQILAKSFFALNKCRMMAFGQGYECGQFGGNCVDKDADVGRDCAQYNGSPFTHLYDVVAIGALPSGMTTQDLVAEMQKCKPAPLYEDQTYTARDFGPQAYSIKGHNCNSYTDQIFRMTQLPAWKEGDKHSKHLGHKYQKLTTGKKIGWSYSTVSPRCDKNAPDLSVFGDKEVDYAGCGLK